MFSVKSRTVRMLKMALESRGEKKNVEYVEEQKAHVVDTSNLQENETVESVEDQEVHVVEVFELEGSEIVESVEEQDVHVVESSNLQENETVESVDEQEVHVVEIFELEGREIVESVEEQDVHVIEGSNLLENEIVTGLPEGEPMEIEAVPCTKGANTEPSTSSGPTRARLRKPETWKKNIRQKKMFAGEEYKMTGGKIKPARSLKEGCGARCKLACSNKLNVEKRKEILKEFLCVGNINFQRVFINRHMEKVSPRYQYKVHNSNRGDNYNFFLTLNGLRVRVCKKMFMATLDIGDRLIRSSLSKFASGALEMDKRGCHSNHKSVSDDIKNDIRNHILSYPKVESHYIRKQSSRQYIDGGLTIASMYRMYIEECQSKHKESGTFSMYSTIFNNEFNIGFFLPKKDQCSLCESYRQAADKTVLQQQYDEHHEHKNLCRLEKEKDMQRSKDGSIIAVCYDLQAVLPSPCGDVSQFYYKRRLASYNFTMYHLGINNGYCFFWDETIGKRGVNEIASCVLRFLSKHCIDKDVVFYSDNCPGQQKNKFMVAMYMYAVHTLHVRSIQHNFFAVGHGQNEGDSMHSTIEKEKKRCLKSGPIYIPPQWVSVIKTSKKSGKPYIVEELSSSNIMDMKDLCRQIGTNFVNNADKEKVVWADIKKLRVELASPGEFHYNTSFRQESVWKNVSVRKASMSLRRSEILEIKKAYPQGPSPISQEKKKDLISLCKAGLIPDQHHYYFERIRAGEIVDATAVDDE